MKILFILMLLVSVISFAGPVTGKIGGKSWTYSKAFYLRNALGTGMLWLTSNPNATCNFLATPLADSIMVAMMKSPINGTYNLCVSDPNCLGASIFDGSGNYMVDKGTLQMSAADKILGSISATNSYSAGYAVSGDFIAEICK